MRFYREEADTDTDQRPHQNVQPELAHALAPAHTTKKKRKIFYSQEPPSGETTTSVRGVNHPSNPTLFMVVPHERHLHMQMRATNQECSTLIRSQLVWSTWLLCMRTRRVGSRVYLVTPDLV